MTDFTYVAAWSGFVYVAFAIDLYSRAIVGWQVSTVKDTAFVESACAWRSGAVTTPAARSRRDDPSQRCGQPITSIRFTETVALEGLVASIGSVGDAYDNAADVMGLFKKRRSRRARPSAPGRCAAPRTSRR